MFRVICLLTICFSLLKHGSAQQNGSFKDVRDGKVYKTVKIGSQEWMAENLNTDRFRNGDFIPQAKTWEELVLAEKTKQPAWFAPEIDGIFNTSDKSIGKFYNWYAVTDQRGLAPQGWYIPTRLDWEPLRIMEGRSIKVSVGSYTNREDWLDLPLENIGNHAVRNETGFSAIPTYITRILPVAAYWWSMSNFNSDEAYIFSMGNSNVDEIYEGTFPKYFSLSVRCFRKVGNEKINTGLKQNTTTNNNNSVNNSPLFKCSDLAQKIKYKIDNTKLNLTGDGNKDADNFIETIIKPAASEYITSIISNANREVSKEERDAITTQTISCIKNIDFKFNNTNTPSNRNNTTTGNTDPLSNLISDYLFYQTFRSPSKTTNSPQTPRYGDVNTNNYDLTTNAWQCSKCGVLSKGQKQPGRYDNGNCTIGSSHTYGEANTTQGYQCKKCGRKYYLLNRGRGSKGPCCGEFGNCSIGTNHDWREF